MTLLHRSTDFRDLNFRYRGCLAMWEDNPVLIRGVNPDGVVEIDVYGNGDYRERPREEVDPTHPEFGFVNKNSNFAIYTYRTVERSYQYGINIDFVRSTNPSRALPSRVRRYLRRPNDLSAYELFKLNKEKQFPQAMHVLRRALRGTMVSQAISPSLAIHYNGDNPLLFYRNHVIGWLDENGEVTLPQQLLCFRELVEEYFNVRDAVEIQQDNPFNEEEEEEEIPIPGFEEEEREEELFPNPFDFRQGIRNNHGPVWVVFDDDVEQEEREDPDEVELERENRDYLRYRERVFIQSITQEGFSYEIDFYGACLRLVNETIIIENQNQPEMEEPNEDR